MTKTVHDRLKIARATRFETPTEAARAMGIAPSTYLAHENGYGGLSRAGPNYARFFRVSLDWLMTGRGDMRGRLRIIPVDGLVGAGAFVERIADPQSWDAPREVEIPTDGDIAALMVRGDSQWPRFLDGEYILYDRTPLKPGDLVDQYAVVQTLDGRRLIKIIRAHGGGEMWRLESHNAPPETVPLMGAWRFLGLLPKARPE